MFEKDMRFALLLDYYGELLGEHRRTIMELYYCEDLSLAEIAENTGITRQAVRDSIKKSEAELCKMDEALQLSVRLSQIAERCETARAHLAKITALIEDEGIRASLSELSEEIRNIPN